MVALGNIKFKCNLNLLEFILFHTNKNGEEKHPNHPAADHEHYLRNILGFVVLSWSDTLFIILREHYKNI